MYRFELTPSLSNPSGQVKFVDVEFLAYSEEPQQRQPIARLTVAQSERVMELMRIISAKGFPEKPLSEGGDRNRGR